MAFPASRLLMSPILQSIQSQLFQSGLEGLKDGWHCRTPGRLFLMPIARHWLVNISLSILVHCLCYKWNINFISSSSLILRLFFFFFFFSAAVPITSATRGETDERWKHVACFRGVCETCPAVRPHAGVLCVFQPKCSHEKLLLFNTLQGP